MDVLDAIYMNEWIPFSTLKDVDVICGSKSRLGSKALKLKLKLELGV